MNSPEYAPPLTATTMYCLPSIEQVIGEPLCGAGMKTAHDLPDTRNRRERRLNWKRRRSRRPRRDNHQADADRRRRQYVGLRERRHRCLLLKGGSRVDLEGAVERGRFTLDGKPHNRPCDGLIVGVAHFDHRRHSRLLLDDVDRVFSFDDDDLQARGQSSGADHARIYTGDGEHEGEGEPGAASQKPSAHHVLILEPKPWQAADYSVSGSAKARGTGSSTSTTCGGESITPFENGWDNAQVNGSSGTQTATYQFTGSLNDVTITGILTRTDRIRCGRVSRDAARPVATSGPCIEVAS